MVGGTFINRFSLTFVQLGAIHSVQTRRVEKRDETFELQQLQRAAAGDAQAISLLHDAHAPALHRVLTAILNNSEDAEDALQETFLKLLDGKMRGAQNVRAYLLSSARHVALDMLRRRKREQKYVIEIDEATPDFPNDVLHLLQLLPREQREVVALKVFEEMTFAEIARVVKSSPNTAASRYRYAMEKLRQMLREDNDE